MRNINKKVCIIITSLLVSSACFAGATRHLKWDKTPIPIHIKIGSEKIISFPASITPMLPANLVRSGVISSINNNGTLYLTASKPFASKIAEVKIHDANSNVVLLDISADSIGNTDQLSIVIPTMSTRKDKQSISEDRSIGDMVRWVSQQLYAPKRLLTRPDWIVRTPMMTNRFVPLYAGGIVSAMPLASWKSNDYYITSVLLRNVQKNQKVYLRYSLIRGRWIAISFFRPTRLNPAILTPLRTPEDSTAAILVSSVPFIDALKEGVLNV